MRAEYIAQQPQSYKNLSKVRHSSNKSISRIPCIVPLVVIDGRKGKVESVIFALQQREQRVQ